jgi:hypothetical protein
MYYKYNGKGFKTMNYLPDFRGKILAKKVEKTNYLSSPQTATRTPCTEKQLKHLQKCRKQICQECSEILKK